MTEGEPELARGELVAALHLTDAALAADAPHAKSLEARLQALQKLRAQSHNSNESGCLDNKLRKSLRKDYTKNVELDPVVPDIITSAVEPNENFIVRVDSTHGQHY